MKTNGAIRVTTVLVAVLCSMLSSAWAITPFESSGPIDPGTSSPGKPAATVAPAVVPALTTSSVASATPAVWRAWAETAWAAIDRHMMSHWFWVRPPRFYEHPGGKHATVWPLSQVVAASLDLVMLGHDRELANKTLQALERYERDGSYNPSENRRRQDRYYDDNAWIALDFLQAYAQTNDARYLAKAQRVYAFLKQGLHRDGGLYWAENQERMSRNTCSNGPAIEVALHLYQISKDEQYLVFARNLMDFCQSRLRSPEGLFYDNLGDDGSLGKDYYSYNQGTMIGADVLMAEVTHDGACLKRAVETAQSAVRWLSDDDRLWKTAPAFHAVFFRNLLRLDLVAPDPRYRAMLASYLQRARSKGLNASTGLYGGPGMGKYEGKVNETGTIDQAAFVQMHALMAMTPAQIRLVH